MEMDTKIQKIIDYLNKKGGCVQFHLIDNIYLSTINEELKISNKLYEVVDCPESESIFGIKNIPFSRGGEIVDRIINEINKYEKE